LLSCQCVTRLIQAGFGLRQRRAAVQHGLCGGAGGKLGGFGIGGAAKATAVDALLALQRLLAQLRLNLGGGQVVVGDGKGAAGFGQSGLGLGQGGALTVAAGGRLGRVGPQQKLTRLNLGAFGKVLRKLDNRSRGRRAQFQQAAALDLAVGGQNRHQTRHSHRHHIGRKHPFLRLLRPAFGRAALIEGGLDRIARKGQ